MKVDPRSIPDYAISDMFKACQLAYRKSKLDDNSITDNEVNRALYVALSNALGDSKFMEWVNSVTPD